MKKKIQSQLWLYLAFSIFFTMIATILVISIIFLILIQTNVINIDDGIFPFPLVFIFLSVMTGTVVSLLLGRRIMQPISQLSAAMKLVSKGNFSIQLEKEEKHKIEEISSLINDFNLMVRELGSIETFRNNFITDVSHEFKTPISSIKGYAKLIVDERITKDERENYIQRITDSVDQLEKLSGNILKISKLENQEIVPDNKVFRLDEQLREIILFLEPQWKKKQLSFEIDCPCINYYGNEELLYQVWLNIIDNAIKYSFDGEKIVVQLIGHTDYVEIYVEDQGIGMTSSTIEKIYEKFFQGDTSRKTKGNGLGMTLVKRIMDLIEGTITIQSENNKGTSVMVRLPRVD